MIGGSGNGEQIAANKVDGVRAALVWSEETARLAREHNDANVISVGGRMHTVEDMTRFVEVFLGHRRSPARSGTPAGSAMLADYEKTGNLPPLPDSALGHRPAGRRRCPRGTPSTGSPHDLRRRTSPAAPCAVTSPQGRFAESARAARRHRLDGAESYGKHLFVDFDRRPLRARAPRPLRQVRRARRCRRRRRVGQVRLRLVAGDGERPPAYGDLRGATACELLTGEQQRR